VGFRGNKLYTNNYPVNFSKITEIHSVEPLSPDLQRAAKNKIIKTFLLDENFDFSSYPKFDSITSMQSIATFESTKSQFNSQRLLRSLGTIFMFSGFVIATPQINEDNPPTLEETNNKRMTGKILFGVGASLVLIGEM
jgi:hypothetical protein